jgi:prepilin-type N-terminal cleavage/methylation domain-containing protein/prepilin-type processing-associated H-X9-DG protein
VAIVTRRAALTLIELLVVLSIIAILIGLLAPAVQKVREAANRLRCSSNLKQIALAVHHFHDAEERLPYSQFGTLNGKQYGYGPGSYAWSWLARLLPFIEQDNLYMIAHIPTSKLSETHGPSQPIRVFLCPSDRTASPTPRTDVGNLKDFPVGRSSYKGVSGANWGDGSDEFETKPAMQTDWPNSGANGSKNGLNFGDGLFYRRDLARRLALHQIADGTSCTFAIGEDVQELNIWVSWPYANTAHGTCAIPPNVVSPVSGRPYAADNWENTSGFRSRHPGGLQFALADGSVRFVRDTIDLEVYRALATYAGGEAVSVP